MKYLIIFLLMIGVVNAVNVDTATYRIDCSPEVAMIQADGYKTSCEYTLKSGYYKGDVAFCFDTLIMDASVRYYGINGLVDITGSFKYKNYSMFKGDCYYLEDIVFNTSKRVSDGNGSWNYFIKPDLKKIDILFKPLDSGAVPKWDTYFGDVSTNRVDLLLDPLYSLTEYEVGTFRDLSYAWSSYTDVLSSSCFVNGYNVSSLGTSLNTTFNSSLFDDFENVTVGYNAANNWSPVVGGLRINTSYVYNGLQSVMTVPLSEAFINNTVSDNTSCEFWMLVNETNRFGNNAEFGLSLGSNGYNVIGSSVLSNNYFLRLWNRTQFVYLNSTINKSVSWTRMAFYLVNRTTAEFYINSSHFFTDTNMSSTFNLLQLGMLSSKTNNNTLFTDYMSCYKGNFSNVNLYINSYVDQCNVTSKNISLSLLVDVFTLNSSFKGDVFVNISFDGNTWNLINLSNRATFNLTDSLSDNNVLMYKLLLNNNLSTVYNFTVSLGGFVNNVNISIFNELTGALITQNVSVTLTDFTNPNIVINSTLTGRLSFFNLNNDLYELRFSSQNFSERRYYVNVSAATSSSLNAYLLPINSSTNYSVYIQSQASQGVIPDALIVVQKNFNSSWVTIAQRYTDILGYGQLSLLEGYPYYVCIYADGFDVKCFPFEFYSANSPYYFRLSGQVSSNFDSINNHLFYSYSPNNFSHPLGVVSFSWYVLSPDGLITNSTIWLPDGSIATFSGSPSGGLLVYDYNFTSIGSYPIIFESFVSGYDRVFFNISYNIYDPASITIGNASIPTAVKGFNTFKSNNSNVWTALAAVFCIILAVVTIMQLSGSPIAGNLTVIFGILFFTVIGYFDLAVGVVLGIVGLGSFFFNRQGGY